MQFDRAHLRGADQRLGTLDHQQRRMFGVQRWIELGDVRNAQLVGVLLEEQLTVDTFRGAHQCQRPPLQVRQGPGRHFGVEAREFELGRADRRVDDPLRVADAHARGCQRIAGALPRGRRAGDLTGDRLGRLVRAQPMEHRMPHHALARHLGVGHFAHQLRFEPVRPAHIRGRRRLGQRRAFGFQRPHLGVQAFQRRLIEAGADLAGVLQLAVIVMQTQQQRPETAARALGFGITDDDEFLPILALDLHPAVAAAGHVAAPRTLADQPFETHLAGALENALGLLAEVGGKPQQLAVATLEQPGQQRSALFERHLAQVVAFQIGRIEQVVEDAAAAPGLERVLQRLEVGCALLAQHHHLAVQPGRIQPEPGQRFGLPRHLRRPVVAITGEQLHPLALDTRQEAVAVELDLVAPVTLGYRFDERRQLRLETRRQFGGHGALRQRWRGRLALAPACPLAGGRRRRLGRTAATGNQRALAEHAVRLLGDDVVLALRPCLLVVGLDQEPLLLVALHVRAHQIPHAGELFALQFELELALAIGLGGVALWNPDTAIPDDHLPGAIVPVRDAPLEAGVIQRMVFDVHRQPPDLGVQARPLGNRPAL